MVKQCEAHVHFWGVVMSGHLCRGESFVSKAVFATPSESLASQRKLEVALVAMRKECKEDTLRLRHRPTTGS